MHDSPDAVAQAFVAAINAGDVDAALELWLDDAVLIGPRGEALRGRGDDWRIAIDRLPHFAAD